MAIKGHLFLRAVLLGLLSWLIPFLTGFILFPVKKSNVPLFTTLMYLIVLVTAGVLLMFYFRRRAVASGEAALVGIFWLGMNLIFDFPMFAFGPMRMTAAGYYSEIGLVYLTFPLFGLLAARLAHRDAARTH